MSTTALIVALVSVIISTGSTVFIFLAQREQARTDYERSRKDEQDAVVTRYREPLIAAAFELQSRVYNIARLEFVPKYLKSADPAERDWARSSTLWLLGTYLGWVELLRRDLEHPDLGDPEQSRALQSCLLEIRGVLRRDTDSDPIRIFHAYQRAIGEVMIATDPGAPGGRCLGYAAFCERMEDARFAGWFAGPAAEIERLIEDPAPGLKRLVDLHTCLIALIDMLDPDKRRYPEAERRLLLADLS